MLRAAVEIERRVLRRTLWAAWHVAAFSRGDKLPELGPLLDRVSAAGDDEEAPEDQMAAMRALAAAVNASQG